MSALRRDCGNRKAHDRAFWRSISAFCFLLSAFFRRLYPCESGDERACELGGGGDATHAEQSQRERERSGEDAAEEEEIGLHAFALELETDVRLERGGTEGESVQRFFLVPHLLERGRVACEGWRAKAQRQRFDVLPPVGNRGPVEEPACVCRHAEAERGGGECGD